MKRGRNTDDAEEPSAGELEARIQDVDRGVSRVRRKLADIILLRTERAQRERAEEQQQAALEEASKPEAIVVARAPAPDPDRLRAHVTLEELEAELRRLEMELANLAVEQRRLVAQGIPDAEGPFRKDEYTLYARLREGQRGHARIEYLFLQDPMWDTIPAPKPPGFKAVHPVPEEPPRLLSKSSTEPESAA